MTGLPDGLPGDAPGEEPFDPLEPLLRPPAVYLAPPAGSFETIRRRAARRRRGRALAGGTLAVAVISGAVLAAAALTRDDSQEVVPTPANSTEHTTTSPGPTKPPVVPPPGPTPSRTTPTPGGGPSTVTTEPTRTPPTTPTTGTDGTGGSTPLCTAAQLTPSLGGGDAGAGSVFRYLVLTNHSGTVCHVTGFPGLSLLDADGKQIGAPATYQQLDHQPVVLRPGESASDTIRTVNQQGTCLPTSTSLRIYPPGSRQSLVFPGKVTNCDNEFVVTPFTKGTTGNPAS
ncbi:Protein of unknown function [Actinacidiphila alni]|uniref:DUF4232 domain-containing protein n=1 Tax=Actinacidiphila alni TaxID=380248 RepID=A0A1I2IL26_9ACTN|nr:DUF4232 domain-containing protein [Actinacidiphila alni]SFF41221.1 Protein of unknown function [Actinacidiphila alni]